MRITALPSHESDLVCRVAANGFTVTEAWSPPRRIPWHAHEEHSLTILLEGIFEERYQQVRHPLECRAGSVVVRPAGKGHENRLGRDGGRTLSIELDAARLHVYGKDLAALLALSHQREQAFLDLGMAMSAELRLCDAVGRGDEAPPLGTSLGPLPGTALGTALGTGVDTAAVLALESLTLELLSRLLRMAQEHKSGTPPAWLVSARNAIHDRFREAGLRVCDLAAEQGVHPVYLARAFRQFYGVTPGEYVRRLRLERARERVMHSPEALATIALECGFADQSHLARAFRGRFGTPPGRFRRRMAREKGNRRN